MIGLVVDRSKGWDLRISSAIPQAGSLCFLSQRRSMSECMVDWLVFRVEIKSSMVPHELLVQDAINESFAIEGLQILGFFAKAGVINGESKLLLDGKGHAAVSG